MRKSSTVIAVIVCFGICASVYAQAQSKEENKPTRERIEKAAAEVKANPQSAEAYYNLGTAYLRSIHHKSEAIDAFQKATAIKPDYVAAFVDLGKTFDYVGEMLFSVQAFHRAIELDPACFDAFLGLGVMYNSEEHYEEAVEAYRQAIKLKPDSAEGYTALARSLTQMKQYTEAFVCFKRAIENSPKPIVNFDFQSLAVRSGRYDEAIALYKEAIKLHPEDSTAHFLLAEAYESVKNYQEALTIQKKLVTLQPEQAIAHYRLSVAYMKVGDKEAALAEYWVAASLYEKMPDDDNPIKKTVGRQLNMLLEQLQK